mmetsp:Transcript_15337/g.22346  ORF Transcript_15337/g.22346 Transcript_15337/m.22346 type:complete len:646 (-) Transcript_15337:29-1966(-)|eukprot:CAMPEP_0194080934 /NCGR_PEP_ID=MMETSP0149-20130528/6843_1 /TAXON_ID=122233 /ORGANISM="Chaetoceros debilis, Strain MM31A-1" /LENGTH=645 /DNA_ID=CAMNT_0038762755 /DNA_START=274 /DNA_END=2211 /DNA_ORIENTATION=+
MKLSTAWSTTILLIAGSSSSSSSSVDAFQPIAHKHRASRTSPASKPTISRNDPKFKFRLPSLSPSTLLLQMKMASDSEEQVAESPLRGVNLFNSLTNQKDPFTPLSQSKAVSMYTCGPTVYDYAHVGNFRAFLTYDVLKRALSYFKYDVDHICNLTDVDDKIIARCTREDRSLLDVTRTYERKFMEDLEALNIIPARSYPRATEHIDEMVELIQMLESNGLAYQSEEGSWYFNVEKKEGYGQQLVKLDVGNMKKNASGVAGAQRNTDDESEDDDIDIDMDADEYDADKVGARDFALWKAYKPEFDRDDAIWDTVIGKGRPGWHLECSAMARKYLGDSIDIHCGGIDLKFPHHENEIAQSEGATGKNFCSCWLHNGFVNIGEKDEKMSKSKGNFLTLRTACPTNDEIRAYRYLVVSSQYRNPLSFTKAATGAAKGALKRMDSVMMQLNNALDLNLDGIDHGDAKNGNGNGDDNNNNEIIAKVNKELENFENALADDLSMPRAAASLFGVVKAAETEFKRYKKEEKAKASNSDSDYNTDETLEVTPLDLVGLASVRDAMHQMDQVFGIFYEVPKEKNDDGSKKDEKDEPAEDSSIPDEVMELVQSRTDAKEAKDWDLADSLRSRITELGFAVKDVKGGGDPIVSRLD